MRLDFPSLAILLFAACAASKDGSRLFEHSWIGLKTASTPAPSDWSSERKLFVGSTYATSDDSIIGAPEVRLAQLHPDLAICAVPTEPGVLAAADGIYVTLYCAATNPADGRQVLLRRSRTTSSWVEPVLAERAATIPPIGAESYTVRSSATLRPSECS